MIKKARIHSLLQKIDAVVPIYPKDYLLGFNLSKNRFFEPAHLNRRFLEMQYFNDFDNLSIWFQSFRYRKEKSNSLYVFSKKTGKHERLFSLPENATNIKMWHHTFFYLARDKDNSFRLAAAIPLLIPPISTKFRNLDFLSIDDKKYMLLGEELYVVTLTDNKLLVSGASSLSTPGKLQARDISAVSFDGWIYFACRLGANAALDTYISIYRAPVSNPDSWDEVAQLKPSDLPKRGFHGFGFPTIRHVEGELLVLFSAWWGKHLLNKKTLSFWEGKKHCRN